jgi:hypothetical protein
MAMLGDVRMEHLVRDLQERADCDPQMKPDGDMEAEARRVRLPAEELPEAACLI